jgi:hypothetical protein
LLTRARVLLLALPLFALFSTAQVACGGQLLSTGTASSDVYGKAAYDGHGYDGYGYGYDDYGYGYDGYPSNGYGGGYGGGNGYGGGCYGYGYGDYP